MAESTSHGSDSARPAGRATCQCITVVHPKPIATVPSRIQRRNSTIDVPSRAGPVIPQCGDCIQISYSIDFRSAHAETTDRTVGTSGGQGFSAGIAWQPGVAPFTGQCEP